MSVINWYYSRYMLNAVLPPTSPTPVPEGTPEATPGPTLAPESDTEQLPTISPTGSGSSMVVVGWFWFLPSLVFSAALWWI
jgi:hypothetical protein